MNSNSSRGFSKFLRTSRYFWIGLLAFLLASAIQYLYVNFGGSQFAVRRIEERVNGKIDKLEAGMDQIILSLDTTKEGEASFITADILIDYMRENEYSFYLYWCDSLVLWSDNSLVLGDPITSGYSTPELITLPNVYGLCVQKSKGNFHLAGIIPLQFRFSLENEFLSNRFLISGRGGAKYRISGSSSDYDKGINDKNGDLLFGLNFLGMESSGTFCWLLILIFNIIAILSLLLFMIDLLHLGLSLWKTNWWFLALAGDFVLIRWLLSFLKFPGVLYQTRWFDSYSDPNLFLGSRGGALISVVFILFYVIALGKHLRIYPMNFTADKREESPRLVDSFTAAGWLVVLVLWFWLTRFWEYVLNQCEDIIELHNILSMTVGSLLDIILMAISAAVFILVLYRLIKQTIAMYPIRRFILIPFTTGVVFFSATRFAGKGPDMISLLALLLLILICGISMYRKKNRLSQLGMGLILLVLSVYMVYFIDMTNRVKEGEIQIELIENLANEHDPIAEMLLKRIDTEIETDSTLIKLVRNPSTQEEKVRTYLMNNHFGPYWNRYKINVNVCDSVNMLVVGESTQVRCLDNWNSIKDNDGQVLDKTHFYYVDYLDGIIWYLGIFPIYTADSSYAYHLIISAESELMPEGLGYPEVLVAGDIRKDSLWNGYSYAKYRDCQLISWSGDYNYASTCASYPSSQGGVVYYEEGSFDHWIRQLDERSVIILSKPKASFLNYLVAFSYLFVSFYILWLVLFLIMYLPQRIRAGTLDLKSRIQMSIVSILVISFILIGGGMNYFIVNQYDQSNRNTISEKIQSVLIEVKHKLEFEDKLTADWSTADYPDLQALLVKFSYVFNTDINIYSSAGGLLASSRPEVFTRHLISRNMDPAAYYDMATLNHMEFIQRENIRNLGFWSAYVPFYNYRGDLLAYLNLPYFSKQSELRKEVSTFLVAMLNGYFLLIFLAVVIAVFLGNQVTRPLRLLQEKFSHMHLGGTNTQIAYDKNDEIGGLVKAYNQMVQEIENSAEKLARSERESAWREMAKQIAHEIKNPLTPMKLSVQHLKRSWEDRVEDWDSYFERVTGTLVEQIDALSAIANEFSQFATMPRANRQRIDFAARIRSSISLYRESCEGSIAFEVSGDGEIFVMMDKEQLVQILNNLLKNAFQAVPIDREPEIKVSIVADDKTATLTVSDNGRGIPKGMQKRLFQPNFTTKTSGMGLGLAISKNIVENSKGRIWFESSDAGATFFVELPRV